MEILSPSHHFTNAIYSWDALEEKPTEGQWTYFARGSHTGTTQAN